MQVFREAAKSAGGRGFAANFLKVRWVRFSAGSGREKGAGGKKQEIFTIRKKNQKNLDKKPRLT